MMWPGGGCVLVERQALLGREIEVEEIALFLDSVPLGPVALLLEGDAGIGKTALWQECARLARKRGFRALTSRSAHSETRIAFATVGDQIGRASCRERV